MNIPETLREVDAATDDGNGIRSCDLCFDNIVDDPAGGPYRRWFFCDFEQLTVCEHCVADFTLLQPTQSSK